MSLRKRIDPYLAGPTNTGQAEKTQKLNAYYTPIHSSPTQPPQAQNPQSPTRSASVRPYPVKQHSPSRQNLALAANRVSLSSIFSLWKPRADQYAKAPELATDFTPETLETASESDGADLSDQVSVSSAKSLRSSRSRMRSGELLLRRRPSMSSFQYAAQSMGSSKHQGSSNYSHSHSRQPSNPFELRTNMGETPEKVRAHNVGTRNGKPERAERFRFSDIVSRAGSVASQKAPAQTQTARVLVQALLLEDISELSSATTQLPLALKRPANPVEVERMFRELMDRRDFRLLPAAARQEMLLYGVDKKWMLIYQDALSEHHKTKQQNTATPEFYTRRLAAALISLLELENLWVSLRTEPIDWVRRFIFDHQGDAALSQYLVAVHAQIGERDIVQVLDDVFAKEFNALKCLRCMMNQKLGAERAKADDSLYVDAATGALLSPRLVTRKIATETLTFMIAYYCQNQSLGEGQRSLQGKYFKILRAMDVLATQPYHEFVFSAFAQRNLQRRTPVSGQNQPRFALWLRLVERTIDGRGKYQNSLVGASEELRYAVSGTAASGTTVAHVENQLLEYCLSVMLLVNAIVEYGSDYRARMHLRTQFHAAGLEQLLEKFLELSYDSLSKQCARYSEMGEADEMELRTSEKIDSRVNFNDPVDLVQALWHNVQDQDARPFFLSAMQHLYLNQMEKKDDPEESARSLRLLNELVQNVATAHTSDPETALGVAMNRLFQSLHTDELYRKALGEAKMYQKMAEEALAERDDISRQLSLGSEGVIQNLSNEVKEQELVMRRTRKLNEELQKEVEDARRQNMLDKQEQEAEMRELLIMLDSGDIKSTKGTGKTTFSLQTNNEQLVNKLRKQIHRKKAELRLDNKLLGKLAGDQIEPSLRLRTLRDQMNDIETLARQLEMTDFETYKVPQLVNSDDNLALEKEEDLEEQDEEDKAETETDMEIEEPMVEMGPKRGVREDDVENLSKLRKQLTSLQSELNDIMKFNNSSLYTKQKFLAMERLRELELNFKDFNIDFEVTDEDAPMLNGLADESVKSKLQQELQEVERLKKDLHSKFSALESKSNAPSSTPKSKRSLRLFSPSFSSDIFSNIEKKYARGQVCTDENAVRTSNGPTRDYRSNRLSTISSMDPKFLKELTTMIGSAEPIQESAEDEDEEEAIVATQPSEKSPNKGLPSEKQVGEAANGSVPPPPPPLPPTFFNAGMANAGAPPPPPPPPPLPAALGGTPVSSSPPPPPPFRTLKKFASPLLPAAQMFVDNFPRPKKKLKQLHWEKVDDNTNNSFWSNSESSIIAPELMEKGVLDEIEVIFASKEAKKLATKRREEADKVSFLARDVAQQFGINLHFFNALPDVEVVGKILRCDKEVMENATVLEFLAKDEIVGVPNSLAISFQQYATNYDADEITKPEKDPGDLQRPDRIYLELIYNLQHYWKLRIRALKTMSSFQKDYEDLVTKLRAIDTAVASIKDSRNLRSVFDIILAVGNYMNDTSKQAKGFKLGSLLRLGFVKDEKNSMSFLHYVERTIRSNYPELLSFLEELSVCADVAKYSIEVIASDTKEYAQLIKNVQSSIDVGNLSDVSKFHPQDRVLKVVSPLLPRAKRKAQLLLDQANYTFKEFDKLMLYFGEDPTDSFVRNAFISKFTNFMAEFKKAQRENMQKEEDEKIYDQRKKLLENVKKQANEQQESADSDLESNVMDSLLDQLKAAGTDRGEGLLARKRALMMKHVLEKTSTSAGNTPPKIESLVKTESGEDSDVGKRARNLLQEVRKGDSTDGSDTDRSTRAAEFRQQRQRRKLHQVEAEAEPELKRVVEAEPKTDLETQAEPELQTSGDTPESTD